MSGAGEPASGDTRYDAFPYPERDPADERKRLVAGSPSHPWEIDHCLFSGRRDWSAPFRALVAGGGTGDGLVQLAAVLAAAGVAAEITYLDPSRRARQVAEARAAVRGLDGIRFLTGSLLDAPGLGAFDYIDCCGVLHHLEDPVAGMAALRAALAPGGGLGFMVYAPYGRSGVYPLQSALGALFGHLPPDRRVASARQVVARLPEGHPFRRNTQLADHRQGDAGFFDLLLHDRDRAFTVRELCAALAEAGLELAGFAQPGLYDPARFLGKGQVLPDGMDDVAAMALAEELDGRIRAHVGYAVAAGDAAAGRRADPRDRSLVPHLRGADPAAVAQRLRREGTLPVTVLGERISVPVDRRAAPLAGAIDGKRSIGEIAGAAGLAGPEAARLWRSLHDALAPWGLLLYSGLPSAPVAGK